MFAMMLMALAGPDAVETGPKSIGDPSTWVRYDDYPVDALRANKGGIVLLDIMIDEQGRAAGCRIVTSAGMDILDKVACAVLVKRGRWEATIDDAGRPVFATLRRRVYWAIPGTTPKGPFVVPPDMNIQVAKLPVTLEQARVVVRQTQRADGSPESCSIAQPSPAPSLNRAACRVAAPLTALDPIINAAGERVRGVRWRTIQFVEKPAGVEAK